MHRVQINSILILHIYFVLAVHSINKQENLNKILVALVRYVRLNFVDMDSLAVVSYMKNQFYNHQQMPLYQFQQSIYVS